MILGASIRWIERRLAAFSRVPDAVQGAIYMTLAALFFSFMNLIVRLTAEELHPAQIPFFRNLFALLFMIPWAVNTGISSLRTHHIRIHLLRAVVGLASMFSWFTAVALLPLADAVALNFSAPLFATVGAALILGEVVRARRWTATGIGFLGTLVILRPGFAEITPTMALPILAAVLMASSMLIVKVLSRHDHPGTIVLYMNLLMTPLSLIPALFVWRWPSAGTWVLFACLGFLASTAHIFFTRAFAKADASAMQPFDFARLPFIALLGYLFFGEVPSGWIWLGGTMIGGAAIYIAHREATLARRGRA